jgi:hypothetical protein
MKHSIVREGFNPASDKSDETAPAGAGVNYQ